MFHRREYELINLTLLTCRHHIHMSWYACFNVDTLTTTSINYAWCNYQSASPTPHGHGQGQAPHLFELVPTTITEDRRGLVTWSRMSNARGGWTASYRWDDSIWEIISRSSRLQGNYQSFKKNLQKYTSTQRRKTERSQLRAGWTWKQ